MTTNKTDIWVYAHWLGMKTPKMVGILSAHQAKGRKAFGFEYARDWVQSKEQFLLDPDIGWFSGPQFPNGKDNFGVFLDSMPDRWGRTLMKRRAAQVAKEAGKPSPTLYDIDFLLGVQDESRMGALRFKTDPDGPFLSDSAHYPIPPISSIRELQQAAQVIESDRDSKDIKKWLAILVAPGSSLGGARPKANLRDEQGKPWIAKFPSQHDEVDKGAWEFLLYKLALAAGVVMAESRMMKVSGKHHTFLTKRFDRVNGERIHFASAMTMTGNNEETLKTYTPSYLDLAEFIRFSGANIKIDLQQLWRRIVFHIAVSNADDHLRNHGFLLSPNGWNLSPAYDLNPSTDKHGLALNVDMDNNALDFELAKSVGQFFQLSPQEMEEILLQVKKVVSDWRKMATQIGIPKQEQALMEAAFRY
ncbi:MAG TPA: HipA domain-containing protein [Haliscomenobacter sp.]|uniref:type II toxin-antitoxin system HipA family toxin n=1 Tax=Haliscomenobacter sp. TaxID=2717303 RepID=UPI002B89E766|nr:HipA domain-containing protein [Haliscomenobacter sp.]HOY16676.1 HipA domain-containing protein [Haliscomenobacter sp.]